MSQTDIFDALAQRFDVEDHKKNPKGFTYIAIEKVIHRFQSVFPAWELHVLSADVSLVPGVTFGNRNPKPAGIAVVSVEVTIDGVTRGGVGGAFQAIENADDMVKTALAEAIKKAGHEFGVGLYLWDEEERALIESAQSQGLTGQVAPATPQVAVTPAQEDVLSASQEPCGRRCGSGRSHAYWSGDRRSLRGDGRAASGRGHAHRHHRTPSGVNLVDWLLPCPRLPVRRVRERGRAGVGQVPAERSRSGATSAP
jgi:hypothetical protein